MIAIIIAALLAFAWMRAFDRSHRTRSADIASAWQRRHVDQSVRQLLKRPRVVVERGMR